jgi:hypothetical protein
MPYALYITPTTFIASNGKLTSARRYMRRVSGTPDLRFVVSKNMDVKNGGLRYTTPSGSNVSDTTYNGTFTGAAAVAIATA